MAQDVPRRPDSRGASIVETTRMPHPPGPRSTRMTGVANAHTGAGPDLGPGMRPHVGIQNSHGRPDCRRHGYLSRGENRRSVRVWWLALSPACGPRQEGRVPSPRYAIRSTVKTIVSTQSEPTDTWPTAAVDLEISVPRRRGRRARICPGEDGIRFSERPPDFHGPSHVEPACRCAHSLHHKIHRPRKRTARSLLK